jgi:hypothetical protein
MRSRLTGHAEGVGEMRNTYRDLVVIHEGKRNLEDMGIDGAIILKCTLK